MARTHCAHREATLVQHDDPEYGWFACYQCDECGTITQHDVTADEIDAASNAPWLDVSIYEKAVEIAVLRVVGSNSYNALAFLGKATK